MKKIESFGKEIKTINKSQKNTIKHKNSLEELKSRLKRIEEQVSEFKVRSIKLTDLNYKKKIDGRKKKMNRT